ncbi:universal stress protein [Planosporangium mesophilum]|uniref:universal stress protein n=1 Tax=Planosporangium mesophilum TaxID=689768 RepID=UPI001EF32C9F|nr:universal stress protein [Planosporangium mesophilum]
MSLVPADREEYGPAPFRLPFECGTDGPRVVMVGIDGSDAGARAAAYASGLARRQGARLVVVFVAVPSLWIAVANPALVLAQEETFRELTAEARRQVRRGADELGLSVTFVCRRGDPCTQLGRVADKVRADLVVVGADGGRWRRWLPGSMVNRLVRAARWPVVVVP